MVVCTHAFERPNATKIGCYAGIKSLKINKTTLHSPVKYSIVLYTRRRLICHDYTKYCLCRLMSIYIYVRIYLYTWLLYILNHIGPSLVKTSVCSMYNMQYVQYMCIHRIIRFLNVCSHFECHYFFYTIESVLVMATSSNISTLEVINAIKSLTVENTRALVFQLGVPVNILDDIETQYNGDNRKQHFIQKWLEIDTSASWGKIVSALQQINMNVLAAGIESMYITKAIVPVPTSGPTTASKPSQSVNTPAQLEAAPLPVTPTPATVKPPTLHLIQFTAVSKERVTKVQVTIKHFEYEFSDIKSDVRVSLSKRESQNAEFVGKFRDHLLDLPVSKRPIHSKFFRENEDEILEASNIPKMFAILGRYCNYSNYDIIFIVVERFCETSLKTRMLSYRDSLEKFEMATTVDVYLCAISAHPESKLFKGFAKMVLKINKSIYVCTLHEI